MARTLSWIAFGRTKILKTGTGQNTSRKVLTNGLKSLSQFYAFSPKTEESIAAPPYPENIFVQSAIETFISAYKIVKWMMVFDKGFYTKELVEKVVKIEGLSYYIPLKQNYAMIKRYSTGSPTGYLKRHAKTAIP